MPRRRPSTALLSRLWSYNVRSFYGEDGRSSVDDILRLIEEQAPDLICLQEFNARLAEQSEEFSLLGEKYEIAHFGARRPRIRSMARR